MRKLTFGKLPASMSRRKHAPVRIGEREDNQGDNEHYTEAQWRSRHRRSPAPFKTRTPHGPAHDIEQRARNKLAAAMAKPHQELSDEDMLPVAEPTAASPSSLASQQSHPPVIRSVDLQPPIVPNAPVQPLAQAQAQAQAQVPTGPPPHPLRLVASSVAGIVDDAKQWKTLPFDTAWEKCGYIATREQRLPGIMILLLIVLGAVVLCACLFAPRRKTRQDYMVPQPPPYAYPLPSLMMQPGAYPYMHSPPTAITP